MSASQDNSQLISYVRSVMEIHQQLPVDEMTFYNWKDWASFSPDKLLIMLSHFLDNAQGMAPTQVL